MKPEQSGVVAIMVYLVAREKTPSYEEGLRELSGSDLFLRYIVSPSVFSDKKLRNNR